MGSLSDSIELQSVSVPLPQGGHGATLNLKAVADIAQKHGLTGRTVEAEALRRGCYPTRYLRNMDSITRSDQIKLLESSIAMVGLGGLGGTLLEMFLRTGIGTIHAADGDSFEESNLNRQALSGPDTLGSPKTEAAQKRAAHVNPSVSLMTENTFLTQDSLPGFLDGASVAIDALGGLTTRLALQQAAAKAKIPLITGALAGWTGYIAVVRPGDIGPADIMGRDNAAEEKLGCPVPAVNCIASLMASETIRILCDDQSELISSMLIIDLKTLSFEKISL